MTALVLSNVALWFAVVVLLLVVLALARQVGILYERIAPMGALAVQRGPAVGERAPRFDLVDLQGRPQRIGQVGTRSQLLFFLSPHCPICKKLLPILKSVAHVERAWLDIVLASDGELTEHLAFYRKAGLEAFPYVLSTELGMTFQVSKLPYAVLVDEQGFVRAKGLVNSREQLESLFTAKELHVGSAQEWLEREDARLHAAAQAAKDESHALV